MSLKMVVVIGGDIMARLIDKDALVAEIKRRISLYKGLSADTVNPNRIDEDEQVLSFIDTLEVKEVDLDIKQRIEECPYRQIGCTMYDGHILECKGACSWVVDYPKLKELKAQKGE